MDDKGMDILELPLNGKDSVSRFENLNQVFYEYAPTRRSVILHPLLRRLFRLPNGSVFGAFKGPENRKR